jgi:hypothetical protein
VEVSSGGGFGDDGEVGDGRRWPAIGEAPLEEEVACGEASRWH